MDAALPERVGDLLSIAVALFPQRPAIQVGKRTLSYRELADAVAATRRDLARLGLESGDRVIIAGDNGPELITLFLAANARGAWPVVVSPRAAAPEIEAIEAHCGPRLSILARAPEALGGTETQAFAALGPVRIRRAAPGVPEPAGAGSGEVAAMIYTSGSTAAPKAAMLSHRNLVYVGTMQRKERAYTENDKTYCPLPLSHIGALSIYMCVLASGACVYLAPRFDPAALARAIRDEGVTVVPGLPALYVKFLEWLRGSGFRFERGSLRLITSGASPLHDEIKADVEALFGLPLQNTYGSTEAPIMAQTRVGEWRDDTSVGEPLPGIRLRVVAANGGDAPAGEEGEILVSGPNVFAGYYRNEEATRAAVTSGGWLKTGDLGYLDRNGNLFVSGRCKDVIIRSGYSIHPAELESLLNAHPGVTLSAAVGTPDGIEENVVVFAQPSSGSAVDARALTAYLAERLAPYKLPDRIVMLEELPTLAVGKVDKVRLRRSMLEA